jgi:hypothetical protein
MGFRSRLGGIGRLLGGESHADGQAELHVGDARFDDWEVVRDFAELEAARAWRQLLSEHDVQSALTADWPLDEFGRGDIALRVPKGRASEAVQILDEP